MVGHRRGVTVGRPTPVPHPLRPSTGDALRVGVGGAVGAVCRWAVVAMADTAAAFPWPTLVVNLLGCFLIGTLVRASRSAGMLLGIGFAGGLTTFSTFAVEVASLLERSDSATAATYLVTSLAGGMVAVVLGHRVVLR